MCVCVRGCIYVHVCVHVGELSRAVVCNANDVMSNTLNLYYMELGVNRTTKPEACVAQWLMMGIALNISPTL